MPIDRPRLPVEPTAMPWAESTSRTSGVISTRASSSRTHHPGLDGHAFGDLEHLVDPAASLDRSADRQGIVALEPQLARQHAAEAGAQFRLHLGDADQRGFQDAVGGAGVGEALGEPGREAVEAFPGGSDDRRVDARGRDPLGGVHRSGSKPGSFLGPGQGSHHGVGEQLLEVGKLGHRCGSFQGRECVQLPNLGHGGATGESVKSPRCGFPERARALLCRRISPEVRAAHTLVPVERGNSMESCAGDPPRSSIYCWHLRGTSRPGGWLAWPLGFDGTERTKNMKVLVYRSTGKRRALQVL